MSFNFGMGEEAWQLRINQYISRTKKNQSESENRKRRQSWRICIYENGGRTG